MSDDENNSGEEIEREPGDGSGIDMVRVTHRVPRSTRDAAQRQTDHGEMSERVRSTYQIVAYGEEVEQQESIRKELETVREEVDEIDAEIRDLESEREALRRKASRLEERLSESDSRKQKYKGQLETLESLLYSGTHVDPTHPAVENAAGVMKISEEDVIEDLKDRNPAIPDYAFVAYNEAEARWDGVNE